MPKRGRKEWQSYGEGPMPISMIAKHLKLDPRTVDKDLKNSTRKILKANKLPVILDWLHAVAEDNKDFRPVIQASSAECDEEFVALWNHKKRRN